MKVEQGREAVWSHAKETGMADDIARIAKIFDLADVKDVALVCFTLTRYYRNRISLLSSYALRRSQNGSSKNDRPAV